VVEGGLGSIVQASFEAPEPLGAEDGAATGARDGDLHDLVEDVPGGDGGTLDPPSRKDDVRDAAP
jgi:hypothetical protein